MKTNISILGVICSFLVAGLLLAVIPTEDEGAIYRDTLRLHILADSDSIEDQTLKLTVRDRLLEKYGAELSATEDMQGAKELVEEKLSEIERDVDGWIMEAGFNYTSRASLAKEWYEARSYGDLTLPGGYYTSLKIELGESDGQNWWCVMYPPLCLDIATGGTESEDAINIYSPTEITLAKRGRYSVRFKLLELCEELFLGYGGNS
ncbi:MAG: stage II sporulation protein R [Clostridia bacterium]|nr:stage II sporulation protein R [Clostridia bacterium]